MERSLLGLMGLTKPIKVGLGIGITPSSYLFLSWFRHSPKVSELQQRKRRELPGFSWRMRRYRNSRHSKKGGRLSESAITLLCITPTAQLNYQPMHSVGSELQILQKRQGLCCVNGKPPLHLSEQCEKRCETSLKQIVWVCTSDWLEGKTLTQQLRWCGTGEWQTLRAQLNCRGELSRSLRLEGDCSTDRWRP